MAAGKEGAVCPVLGHPGFLAKLYFQPMPDIGDKLEAIISAAPPCLSLGGGYAEIVWPVDIVRNADGSCAGYIMKHVRNRLSLESIINPAICAQIDFQCRLRMAANIAWMVAELHAAGYIVGDLSASNILANSDTCISIIDVDSMQFTHCNRRFPCCVGRLEYLPPELHNQTLASVERLPEHDSFALGVCVFLLLMEANHPFQGRWLGNGRRPPLELRIANGWWPHAQPVPQDWRPRSEAPPFDMLHPLLQNAFRRCFQLGHGNPSQRPTAEEWKTLLIEVEKDAAYLQRVVPLYKKASWRNGASACGGRKVSFSKQFDPFRMAWGCIRALSHVLFPAKWTRRLAVAAAVLFAIIAAGVKYRTPIIKFFTPEKKFEYSVEKYGHGKPTPKLWQILRDSDEESH